MRLKIAMIEVSRPQALTPSSLRPAHRRPPAPSPLALVVANSGSNLGLQLCLHCAKGRYAPKEGSSSCLKCSRSDCPPGKYHHGCGGGCKCCVCANHHSLLDTALSCIHAFTLYTSHSLPICPSKPPVTATNANLAAISMRAQERALLAPVARRGSTFMHVAARHPPRAKRVPLVSTAYPKSRRMAASCCPASARIVAAAHH